MKKVYLVTKEERFLKELSFDEFQLVNHPEEAKGIFVLGGDGTMLSTVGKYHSYRVPFFGFNFGHVGFLMNEHSKKVLAEIAEGNFHLIEQRLLEGEVFDSKGKLITKLIAFNDFRFERASLKIIRIRVSVNDKIRFDPLSADGALVCTPAGSTAYNASAGGEILPLEAQALVLTGISPSIYHHWRSSILPFEAKILLEVLDVEERPVRLIADGGEIKDGIKIRIQYSDLKVHIGFAQSQDFREKVLRLQLGK
jgi:NAD+ kinase